MAEQADLGDLRRAVEFLGTPWLVEVLDGLGHGRDPSEAVPADADAVIVDAAVQKLLQVGAATLDKISELPAATGPLVLTPKGRELAELMDGLFAAAPDRRESTIGQQRRSPEQTGQ